MQVMDAGAAHGTSDTEALPARASPPRQALKRPVLTVVVPTRNEAGNIEALLRRIEMATVGVPTEVVFVDDSTDATPAVIAEVAERCPLPVSLLHRPPERRADGLGGAVTEGLRAAAGRWLCVMDADLQHPPEVIPQLLDRAREADSDIVVASRFAPSGEAGGLNLARAAASWLTRLAAKVLFPGRLGEVCDPLSGFFLVRREAIDPDRLRPRGFKILLEILVRFPHLRVREVPFQFERRQSGESK